MIKISRFSILGLFGDRDVHLDLSQNISILIADNGVGKTTILGIVYAVLSGKLARLRRVEFNLIRVHFGNGTIIEIPQSVVQPSFEASRKDPRFRRLLRELPESMVHDLFEATRGLEYAEFIRHPYVKEISQTISMPPRYVFDLFRANAAEDQLELDGVTGSPERIRKAIAKAFPETVLYFPTYRRIEEELEQLGYERKERFRTEALIQFGMGDVDSRIKIITDQIKTSSMAWYSKINGQMLSQLVVGFQLDEKTRESIRNVEALKIVLDRIGDNVNPAHKELIIRLVETNEINDRNHEYLLYFLSNLIKIYDQQRELDNSIKEFTEVCSRYLRDKSIVYHESSVNIGVYDNRTKRPIELPKLSSGEKQIISLFSRLYLEKREPVAILFDEPELSLSIEWQRMLIPDIIKTGNCSFLMATTHSPFIFENELDDHARDLQSFITQV